MMGEKKAPKRSFKKSVFSEDIKKAPVRSCYV
jgi:hypothetical protein